MSIPPRAAPRVTNIELQKYTSVALAMQLDRLPARISVENCGGNVPVIHDRVARRELGRQVRKVFAEHGLTVRSLVEVGVLIAKSPIVFAPRGTFGPDANGAAEWAAETAAITAFVAVSMWGQRARVFRRSLPLVAFLDAVRADTPIRNVSVLLEGQVDFRPRRPNVVVLTPLGGLTDDQQEELLVRARAIEEAVLATFDVTVLVPGETIHPSTESDEDSILLYMSARSKVIDADYVVIVAGTHDSWGNALCVSWVEALNTPVVVFRDGHGSFSKVLSRSYFRTRALPSVNAQGDADAVVADLTDNFSQVIEHAKRRDTYLSEILPLMPLLEDLIGSADGCHLTPERLEAIVNNPSETQTLSQLEIRALKVSLGQRGHELTGILFGELRGRWSLGDDRIAVSLSQFVSNNPGVSGSEALTMLRFAFDDATSIVDAAAANLGFDGGYWVRLLRRMRGSGAS